MTNTFEVFKYLKLLILKNILKNNFISLLKLNNISHKFLIISHK